MTDYSQLLARARALTNPTVGSRSSKDIVIWKPNQMKYPRYYSGQKLINVHFYNPDSSPVGLFPSEAQIFLHKHSPGESCYRPFWCHMLGFHPNQNTGPIKDTPFYQMDIDAFDKIWDYLYNPHKTSSINLNLS